MGLLSKLKFWKRDSNDPLVRLLFDKYMFNMLSIPREKVELGDVYRNDKSDEKLYPATNIKNFLTPEFQMPIIDPPETMVDISGLSSRDIDANIGLDFLQNFLNVLSSLDLGATIKAKYDASRVNKIKYQFTEATRQHVDPFLFGEMLNNHKVKTDNPAFNPETRYFIVMGVIRTKSVDVEAEDQSGNKVDVDVGVAQLIDVNSKIEVNKSRQGTISYKGEKDLVLGVELCELMYTPDNKFKIEVVEKEYKVREGNKDVVRKDKEARSLIGDPLQGNVFVETA
jgi:hypothetical protein